MVSHQWALYHDQQSNMRIMQLQQRAKSYRGIKNTPHWWWYCCASLSQHDKKKESYPLEVQLSTQTDVQETISIATP
eukprot:6481768-Amphidinium_carterae.3